MSEISHGNGNKRVFISNKDTKTKLTQFAWSKFTTNQSCEMHTHPTMDEYFFVLQGSGIYHIDNKKLNIKKGDFIRIPAGTPHQLHLRKHHKILELIYFGIDTTK
tara:strand:- start:124 stop:438 length:315 start_codon:yes stop_codon:yes gene_type:complete